MARNVSIVSKTDTVEIIVDGNKIDGITKYSVEESAEKPVEVSISFFVTDSLEGQWDAAKGHETIQELCFLRGKPHRTVRHAE